MPATTRKSPKKPASFLERQSKVGLARIITNLTSGEPPMDNNIGNKWIDRFDADVRELRSDIKELKYWTVGTWLVTFFGLAALIIGLFTYHANVMQSQFSQHQAAVQAQTQAFQGQMQAFSDYVKAVTQPQPPKLPKPSK